MKAIFLLLTVIGLNAAAAIPKLDVFLDARQELSESGKYETKHVMVFRISDADQNSAAAEIFTAFKKSGQPLDTFYVVDHYHDGTITAIKEKNSETYTLYFDLDQRGWVSVPLTEKKSTSSLMLSENQSFELFNLLKKGGYRVSTSDFNTQRIQTKYISCAMNVVSKSRPHGCSINF